MLRLLVTFSLVLLSGGCNYIAFTAGPDSEYGSAASFTIEYSGRAPGSSHSTRPWLDSSADPCSVPSERDFMFSSGFLYIDNGLDLYWYRSDPEMGVFLKLGVEAVPDTGLFVNILGGVTWISWSSYWSEDTEWFGLIGGGVTYFIDDKDFCVIASYDNRRLFNAGVGLRF